MSVKLIGTVTTTHPMHGWNYHNGLVLEVSGRGETIRFALLPADGKATEYIRDLGYDKIKSTTALVELVTRDGKLFLEGKADRKPFAESQTVVLLYSTSHGTYELPVTSSSLKSLENIFGGSYRTIRNVGMEILLR